MEIVVLVIHVFTALAVIGLVLLQHGKPVPSFESERVTKGRPIAMGRLWREYTLIWAHCNLGPRCGGSP